MTQGEAEAGAGGMMQQMKMKQELSFVLCQ
jgi:hypothetical protein